jgi:hypothetical protein
MKKTVKKFSEYIFLVENKLNEAKQDKLASERIEALELHLINDKGIEEAEVGEIYPTKYDYTTFDTDHGEFLVLLEDEAEDRAMEYNRELIDDIGLEGINNLYMPDYITKYGHKWAEEAHEEYIQSTYEDYITSDIENFWEMCVDKGLIDEPEDDDYSDLDPYDYFDDMIEKEMSDERSHYDWYCDTVGEEEALQTMVDNDFIDIDAICKEIIDIDGVGHTLSSYDGEEYEQTVGKKKNLYYIYRTN